MKFFGLFNILLVVLYTANAKNIINKRDGLNSKSKRSEKSDECKYINSMLEKDNSYNCCGYDEYEYGMKGVKCENGHITEM